MVSIQDIEKGKIVWTKGQIANKPQKWRIKSWRLGDNELIITLN